MIPTAPGVLLAMATAVGVPAAPSGDSALYAWALSLVTAALAGVSLVAWRTSRADLIAQRAETAAARAETSALTKAMMSDVVPAMTRSTDVTARATEALLDRGRRG